MVGPGDVDEDLQPEVAEECAKYGEVERCLIFEVTQWHCMCTTDVVLYMLIANNLQLLNVYVHGTTDSSWSS